MKIALIILALSFLLNACIETKLVNGEKKFDVSETIKSNSLLIVDWVIIGGMIAK